MIIFLASITLSNKLITIEERAEELDKRRNEKISTIALINDKNRKKNIERAELGIKQEMERIKKEGVVSDPFTRRKTQPVLPTHVLKKKEAELKNGPQASDKDGIKESQVRSASFNRPGVTFLFLFSGQNRQRKSCEERVLGYKG